MKTITIQISVPDGVEFRVVSGPPPDDFEHEPLPVETFAADEAFVPNAHVQEPVSMRRDTQTPVSLPVPAASPVAAPTRSWNEGDVHQQGHKPLKRNRRGLFCPTSMGKDNNGNTVFCAWPNAA